MINNEKAMEIAGFYEEYNTHIENIRIFLSEKMKLVIKDDLSALQSKISEEEKLVMKTQSFEQKREKILAELGIPGAKADVFLKQFPEDWRLRIKMLIQNAVRTAALCKTITGDIKETVEAKLEVQAGLLGNSAIVPGKAGYNPDGTKRSSSLEGAELGSV